MRRAPRPRGESATIESATVSAGGALGAAMRAWLAVVVVAPLLFAQENAAPAASAPTASTPPTLAELAQKLDEAHHDGGKREPITAFAATMAMQTLAKDEAHRFDAELDVKFFEWQRDGRQWPLLRYRVLDAATRIEQGRDREDYWGIVEGKAVDLNGANLEQDKKDCRRHLLLARQLLQFLEPGTVLRSLAEPLPVTAESLQIARGKPKVACWVASGNLASFPLRHQAGEGARVRLKAWIDQASGRLLALDVRPLGADSKPGRDGEYLLFADHEAQAGRFVPMTVTHYDIVDDGTPQPQLVMKLTTLRLGAELRVEDFDRPK